MQILKTDDGLREEILKDAQTRANRILAKAQREKEKIANDIENKVKKFREKYTKDKLVETEAKINLIYSTVDMEVKKEVIKYSNELIDIVFNNILQKIQSNELISHNDLARSLIIEAASKIDSNSYILEVAKKELSIISKEDLAKIKLSKGRISRVIEGSFEEGYRIFSESRKIGAYLSLKKFIDELQTDERIAIYKIFLGEDHDVSN